MSESKERIKADKSIIPIVYICDEHFFYPVLVSIQSLIDNKKDPTIYKIYILKTKITQLENRILQDIQTKSVSIECIEVSTNRFERFKDCEKMTYSNVSVAALLKFEIPNILNLDKVLYLDGDTIVQSDLAELYNTDIKDKYLAAVADSSSLYIQRDSIYNTEDYFNSGVILMNLCQMREKQIPDLLYKQKLKLGDKRLMDQNVFNLICTGHVLLLPLKYNFMYINLENAKENWSFVELNKKYNTSYKSLEDIFEECVILHYASRNKPWIDPSVPGADKWEKEAFSLLSHLNGSDFTGFFLKAMNRFYVYHEIQSSSSDSLANYKINQLEKENLQIKTSLNEIERSRIYRIFKKTSSLLHIVKKIVHKK